MPHRPASTALDHIKVLDLTRVRAGPTCVRQLADWVVRRRLLTIPGVAQVFTMGGEGGGQRQVQVLVNPNELRRMGVTLHQVEQAVGQSNENATGGYLIRGPNEILVRSLGRIQSLEDLELLVVDGDRVDGLRWKREFLSSVCAMDHVVDDPLGDEARVGARDAQRRLCRG